MAAVRSYLDWNASAPLQPAAAEAAQAAMVLVGNPSSVHAEGRRGRTIVEAARAEVAALVGAARDDVTFTSGGTEANATALGLAEVGGRPVRLLVGATEHPSIAAGAAGRAPPTVVPVDADGVLDLAALAELARRADAEGFAPHLALALAGNETGVIQPVAAAAAIVHAAGGRIHVDAVQAVGRIPVSLGDLGADTLSLSAHKIGGLAGCGALVMAPDRAPPALIRGGGQERRRRAGTENLAGIAAFGAAARESRVGLDGYMRLVGLRDWLETAIVPICGEVVVFGRRAPRLPNTSLFAMPGISGETVVIALDLAGVAVSAGAACSSGRTEASQALLAAGVPKDLARCAVRASLGWSTTAADVERLVAALAAVAGRGGAMGERIGQAA